MDYRGLNEITVETKYGALPNIEEIFDMLKGAKVFSKLDLISGYHQMRINEQDKSKAAFITYGGQYQWKVSFMIFQIDSNKFSQYFRFIKLYQIIISLTKVV